MPVRGLQKVSTKELRDNIKFVVRVERGGSRSPQFVQQVDPTPIQMTTNRELALVMGKFTAEDLVKSLQKFRCGPVLEPV
jgi:hypothetical protein